MNSIDEILHELYAIDPSFKRHEADLRFLIQRLRLAKPDFSLDDAFVRRLRSDILHSGKPKPVGFLVRSYFVETSKNLFRSSAFGMAVALVLLVPLAYAAQLYRQGQATPSYQVENALVSLGQQQEIVYKPQNAFGSVALTTVAATTSSATTSPVDLSLISSDVDADLASDTLTASSSATTSSSFIFTGSPLTLTQSTANVLETDTSTSSRSDLLSHIQNLNFELTDLTSVATGNDTLGTVEVQESKPYGYIVDIDLTGMSVNISKNPDTWPDETSLPAMTPISAADTVTTALSFLKDHNIDTSNYAPAILLSENAASSTATVLLPLIINQQRVYNIDGSQYGIVITVDQVLGRVTSVTGISLQEYTASPYAMETDFNAVLTTINATTTASTTSDTTATSTAALPELVTPTPGLIHYVTADGEFFVPGLVFPVASSTNTITTLLLKSGIEN